LSSHWQAPAGLIFPGNGVQGFAFPLLAKKQYRTLLSLSQALRERGFGLSTVAIRLRCVRSQAAFERRPGPPGSREHVPMVTVARRSAGETATSGRALPNGRPGRPSTRACPTTVLHADELELASPPYLSVACLERPRFYATSAGFGVRACHFLIRVPAASVRSSGPASRGSWRPSYGQYR
jgi:hypothetical protein